MKTNPANLKFAIIGAGAISRAYAQAFTACNCGRVVAVADISLAAAQTLAAELEGHFYNDYRELAENEQPGAVIICTPPVTHPEIATYFMRRGVHVLCEKPLSVDSASAQMMLETARAQNVVFTMASKFRYVADVIKAKEIVAAGTLGEIILFENAFTARVEMGNRWNANPEISGGGVLIDNGTHSFDILRYFLGALVEVQVVEGIRAQNLAVEDTVRIFTRSAGGVLGSVDLSWSINKELATFINIYGTDGTLSVGWQESKYRLAGEKEWVVFGSGYDKVQAFRSQLQNFARAICTGEPLLVTAEDGVASVEVVEAAYAALKRNAWTSVGSAEASFFNAQGSENILELPEIINGQ